MRALILLAALPILLPATSWVDIREGPAYDGIVTLGSDCTPGDKTIQGVRIDTAVFDDDGREIRRATLHTCHRTSSLEDNWWYTLDSDGTVLSREHWTITLDDRQRPLDAAQHTWPDGKEMVRHYQNSYDLAGRLITNRISESGGSTQTWRITFDERGDPVITTSFGSDGKVESVTTSRFDDQHRLLAEKHDNEPENHHLHYDPQGRLIEEITGEGPGKYTRQYTYDDQGRRLSERTFAGSSHQLDFLHGFSYWPNGLIREDWSFDRTGELASFESYAYDDHGHATQRWTYGPGKAGQPKKFLVTVDGQLQTLGSSNGLPLITYTYDSHGNWVKAVETTLNDSSEPASERDVSAIFYRQIDYK